MAYMSSNTTKEKEGQILFSLKEKELQFVMSGENTSSPKDSAEGSPFDVVDTVKDDDYSTVCMATMSKENLYTSTAAITTTKSCATSPQESSVPKKIPPTRYRASKEFACTLVIIALMLFAILFAENTKLKNKVSYLQQSGPTQPPLTQQGSNDTQVNADTAVSIQRLSTMLNSVHGMVQN